MDGYTSLHAVFASSFKIGSVTVWGTVIWWVLFIAVSAYMLQRTRIGNWIYAVGGNADSARAVGVPVVRVKVGLFMGVAFLGWFIGMQTICTTSTRCRPGTGWGTSSSTSLPRWWGARC